MFFFSGYACYSQIKITLPVSRSVFQRDKQNNADIYVSGSFEGVLEKVEARLIPIKAGQGTLTDWITISVKPDGGHFMGSLKGKAGWYSLEVRGWNNGVITSQISRDRVGIGEVFVIAGQSNAEGVLDYGAKSSVDDRVNCFNYRVEENLWDYPYFSSFSHIESNTMVGPKGKGPWCWGELGDYLAQRLNMPILFLNASYGGSSIENWYNSSLGIPTKNAFQIPYIGNAPYSSLRISLQFYASLLGVRAVLWEQGEDDSQTSEDTYYNYLKKVIERSRSDSDKKLSWVIARTSLNDFAAIHVNPAIIKAQNRLINNSDYIFEGPYTDSIQIPRAEGVHFKNLGFGNEGISDLAKAWDKKLNTNFFNQSVPFLSSAPISIKANCDLSDKVTLSLPVTYESQRWSNNSTSSSISSQSGSYSVITRDKIGNYFFSNTIEVKNLYPITVPFAFAKTSSNFCEGTSTELLTNNANYSQFRWNTGETTKQITVKNSGVYTVRGINSLGCLSPSSNEVISRVIPLPPKPNIFLSSPATLCEGSSITLFASGFGKSFWNTNDSTGSIVLSKVGDYNISVKVRDEVGCISPSSDITKISIKPRPEEPKITQIGAFSLQAEQINNTADAYEWKKDDAFLTTKSSLVKSVKPGFFTVSAIKNYSLGNTQVVACRSNLSKAFSFIPDTEIKNLIIYPNPSPNGIVNIESKEDLSDLSLNVYTINGKYIYSTSIPPLTERRLIDLSFLEEGKYIVRLQNNTFTESKQIWIEK